MSGVTVGTRLQQLRALERAVKVQIELEELAVRRGRASSIGAAYPAVHAPVEPAAARIVRVPVDLVAKPVIRAWGRSNRYEVPSHGPLDQFVVGAFVEAHQ